MTPVLTTPQLERLVRIGEAEAFEDLAGFVESYPDHRSGDLMRQTPEFWYAIAAEMDNASVVSLIKALTVAERLLPGWKAGSVSPVVWLFRKYQEKSPQDADALAVWIRLNSDNPHLPTGSLKRRT
jgi:hypothetical protein